MTDVRDRVESETPPWMANAACREYPTEFFFPTGILGVNEACAVCDVCPMRSVCLEYALDNKIDHGIWGGCSERERRRILKRRRQRAA